MASPLIQKPRKEIKKVLSYDPGPIVPRTCFICINRYPDALTNMSRTIEGKTFKIRICNSCQLGIRKFTPANASAFSTTTEGREVYDSKELMKLTKKELIELMQEHGL